MHDQRIGLAVEAVVGVQKIAPDQVRRLFHDDDPEELFQSAARFGDDAEPTPLLEPRRLMALAGVWAAESDLDSGGHADAAEASAALHAAQRADTVAHASFRIADAHVALPAAHVGELLRHPKLRTELPRHDGVQGLFEWRGRQVPVVDLTGALHALPTGHGALGVHRLRGRTRHRRADARGAGHRPHRHRRGHARPF